MMSIRDIDGLYADFWQSELRRSSYTTPELGRAFLDFRRAVNRLPSLTQRLTIIARFTVAVCEGADYEIFAFQYAAKAKALLTETEMVELLAKIAHVASTTLKGLLTL